MGGPVRISDRVVGAIASHAEQAYPREGCGFLLGRASGGARHVLEARPARNALAPRTLDRYLIEPEELLHVEREARWAGLDVLGFYHSHPDHPASPSEFDRQHAWPWYVYLIVAVAGGRAADARAWLLRDDRAGFAELELARGPEVA